MRLVTRVLALALLALLGLDGRVTTARLAALEPTRALRTAATLLRSYPLVMLAFDLDHLGSSVRVVNVIVVRLNLTSLQHHEKTTTYGWTVPFATCNSASDRGRPPK